MTQRQPFVNLNDSENRTAKQISKERWQGMLSELVPVLWPPHRLPHPQCWDWEEHSWKGLEPRAPGLDGRFQRPRGPAYLSLAQGAQGLQDLMLQ